jgi:AcrR family transcriptional regulator
MARTTGSDGARTEEAIREAAVALIAARGFEATTLREIADKVGVQPGTLYRYFPSKTQLLVSLLVEHLEYLLESWEKGRPRTDDPVALLRAFVDFHIRSHTLRRREVFVANMELRSLSPADRARVVALRRRYEDQLTAILRDGIERGAFRLPDARIATFAILAMLTGVGTWYREGGRLDKHSLIDAYTRLTLQCAGAAAGELAVAAGEPRATARLPRRQAPSLAKSTA